MKGSSSGGTTTYPITIRIDDTDGLRPGMNANAEIVVAEANNALVVPNAAVIRGGYVLVSKKSPSAANAVEDMDAPEAMSTSRWRPASATTATPRSRAACRRTTRWPTTPALCRMTITATVSGKEVPHERSDRI